VAGLESEAIMRTFPLLAALGLAVGLVAASLAQAGDRLGPHPVRGWNGNQFLFEVQPHGDVTHLVGYRAIGHKWQLVGTTRIHKGQRAPAGGFLQQIWFHGRPLGHVRADMSNPWWRWYPSEDRNGGRFETN
jgi:hypothetical protein